MNHMAPEPTCLTVPADPGYLRIVRTVASSAAADGALGLEGIENLALAIDEAGAALLRTPGATVLSVTLESGPGGVVVELDVDRSPEEPWPPAGWNGSLGARVLEAVADEVTLTASDGKRSIRVVVS
jgi:hypothetical protein